MVRRLTLIVSCLLAGAPVYAADHVRVVLDLSKSMRTNDRARLATLSTALLYDLANPDATRGDTFQVIPFDPAVLRWRPPAPLPMGTGTRLTGSASTRASFVRALTALPYDANFTYFYPTLAASLADFERARGEAGDRRVIVLITDGVPERDTRHEEERRLREELVPRLRASGARLYVLAFGTEASAERAFFDQLVDGGLGEVFVDPSGTQLLESMIEIFSRSFGYTAGEPVAHRASTELDLAGGQNPTEVAVVQFWLTGQAKPFKVHPQPNLQRPVQRAVERGAGYVLAWILQPKAGRYTVVSDQIPGRLTVLRPARLRVEVRAGRPGVRPELTLARTRFPLHVVVSPSVGTRADPGEVDLSYEVCVPRGADEICSNPAPPVHAAGTPETTGRVYEIQPIFLADPDQNVEFYMGHIRITAKRRDAIIGDTVHPVAVYPFVELSATPPVLTLPADRVALGPGGRGCAQFSLVVTGGRLPHPANPAYAVRVVLPASLADVPQFSGATFLLDGAPLDVESKPRPVPGPWYSGRALSRAALLGPHEICVQTGRPKAGNMTRPAIVEVSLSLIEAPYDGYPITPRPVAMGVLVAPPGWIDRAAPLVLLLMVVTTVLLLWYTRSRPFVAGDLRCVLSTVDGGHTSADHALAPGPWLAQVLGLAVSRPIVTQAGRVIGWVRPLSLELYELRLARGVRLEQDIPLTLETRRTYVANTPEGQLALRVEYAERRPQPAAQAGASQSGARVTSIRPSSARG